MDLIWLLVSFHTCLSVSFAESEDECWEAGQVMDHDVQIAEQKAVQKRGLDGIRWFELRHSHKRVAFRVSED